VIGKLATCSERGSNRWATVEVESEELFKVLNVTGNEKGDDKYTSSTVVGAEAVAPVTKSREAETPMSNT
jgi:hypothetical protein